MKAVFGRVAQGPYNHPVTARWSSSTWTHFLNSTMALVGPKVLTGWLTIMTAMTAATTDDLFLVANLNPRLTGLPFVVWISPRCNARHDVRVKVSADARAQPSEMVSVGLRPDLHVIEGTLKPADLALLRQWVAINLDVLLRYWDGDIEFTDEAMEALRPI